MQERGTTGDDLRYPRQRRMAAGISGAGGDSPTSSRSRAVATLKVKKASTAASCESPVLLPAMSARCTRYLVWHLPSATPPRRAASSGRAPALSGDTRATSSQCRRRKTSSKAAKPEVVLFIAPRSSCAALSAASGCHAPGSPAWSAPATAATAASYPSLAPEIGWPSTTSSSRPMSFLSCRRSTSAKHSRSSRPTNSAGGIADSLRW
mmetsp:Transcript_67640/g.182753  ORF Transcript_67640/g.182753 Transcript_67640/m.182753 type:complete len:208 (-) Transcript_67640:39-662(-)